MIYESNAPLWFLIASISIILFLYALFFKLTILTTIHPATMCPLFFYAEQVNPTHLTIYRFLKSPTIIKLASSTLNPKPKLKHYTTLTITDKDTGTAATLGLLTPEEYDRFMQYWNAANPPQSTKDQE